MTKKLLSILALLSIMPISKILAISELRSPLSIYRGTIHYPLPPVDDGLFVIENWDAAWTRSASEAFISNPFNNNCNPLCPVVPPQVSGVIPIFDFHDNSTNTFNTRPLSELFFGKANFKAEDVFANSIVSSTVNQPSCTPALSFATLSPRFEYNETGVVFGINVYRNISCQSNWRVGFRASLPFKVIDVTCDKSCLVEESLDNIIAERFNGNLSGLPPAGAIGDQIDAQNQIEYAYRLDFLSSLCTYQSGNVTTPLVVYGNGVMGQPTTIAGIQIDGLFNPLVIPAPVPVFAVYQADGTLPSAPFAALAPPTGIVNADGSPSVSGVNDAPFQFANDQNYLNGLGVNRVAQSKLYIVPQVVPDNSGVVNSDTLTTGAVQIRAAVDSILDVLDFTGRDSALQFLSSKCIFLCDSSHIAALGDLDTEFYGGYHSDRGYADFIFGVRFPTGPRITAENLRKPFYQTTGNNGHFELKGAFEGGYNPMDWFALRFYISGAHAFSRDENRAAPFTGQTVKNIGPIVNVNIYYNYFLGNLDFTFFHPKDCNLGCVIGYELYARGRDKVKNCPPTLPCTQCSPINICPPTVITSAGLINDLLGNPQSYDYSIISQGTNVMTNKIRGEIFKRWQYFELFVGASQVIAGRNAMKESEAHIGVTVNF